MTDHPEYFADRPKSHSWFSDSTDIDAFSSVLSAIGLRGETVMRCSSEPPFDIALPSSDRVLHIAETPGLRVHIDGDPEYTLGVGDMVLLARGTAHRLAKGEPCCVRSLSAADGHVDARDTSTATRWVSGRFTAERQPPIRCCRSCRRPSSFGPTSPAMNGSPCLFSSCWPRSSRPALDPG